MNHHTNRSLVTSTRKRKDRGELLDNTTPSLTKGTLENSHKSLFGGNNNNNNNNTMSFRTITESGFNNSNPSVSSNRLLAGYMAHEFLTKGTLFGQKFDPARAEALPITAAEPKRKPVQVLTGFEGVKTTNRGYTEVAQLLKSDGGAHIPGIVNPTQLARWIRM